MDAFIKNKKANFDYEILERYKAGVMLVGGMIKSIRSGKVSASDGTFVHIKNGEAVLTGIHIDGVTTNLKLLLTKKELNKLIGAVTKKGLTIIMTEMFMEKHRVKVNIALAVGKKLHDKRQSLKEKDMKREADREIKGKY